MVLVGTKSFVRRSGGFKIRRQKRFDLIKPGDLQSPYSLMQSCLLRISNPQSLKRLGHSLTADFKSAERLAVFDNDHKILCDGRDGVTDAVSDFEPLRMRIGIPIAIGSASACAGSYSYCCHKRLSFVTVEMQLLQG